MSNNVMLGFINFVSIHLRENLNLTKHSINAIIVSGQQKVNRPRISIDHYLFYTLCQSTFVVQYNYIYCCSAVQF